jgi:hypothetical protein
MINMKTTKLLLLVLTLVLSSFAEMTDYERYQANKKPFWKALVVQSLMPGFGNCYLDGRFVKPIVYPATIIVFEVGGVILFSKAENKFQESLGIVGFGLGCAVWIYSIIDIFPSYKKYDNKLRIKYILSLSPNSIRLSCDF